MRAFIDAGGRARWDYIIFGHNEHQVAEAEALAAEWGCEKFQKKKSGRFFTAKNTGKDKHQAQNRKGADTQLIEKPAAPANQNLALLKQAEIEKTYGSMTEYYNSCSIKCKAAEKNEIFITAEGLLMPCCWTAGRMYKWWHKDYRVEQIWEHIDQAGGKDGINVLETGLKSAMTSGILDSIKDSWDRTSIADGKLGVCVKQPRTVIPCFKIFGVCGMIFILFVEPIYPFTHLIFPRVWVFPTTNHFPQFLFGAFD